ncbi:MAG: hypothetical protein LBT99_02320 [Bifidobacteriaceae bacterium]|jgi:hypothetical protein|nr:hypothetical protein [Bifidobacteriaceae bacterium]
MNCSYNFKKLGTMVSVFILVVLGFINGCFTQANASSSSTVLPVAKGGTGSNSASGARNNLQAEYTGNKVTSPSSASTTTQYPSAKGVYDTAVKNFLYTLTPNEEYFDTAEDYEIGNYGHMASVIRTGYQVTIIIDITLIKQLNTNMIFANIPYGWKKYGGGTLKIPCIVFKANNSSNTILLSLDNSNTLQFQPINSSSIYEAGTRFICNATWITNNEFSES